MNAIPFSLSLLRRFWPALVAGALVLAIIIQTFRLQATEGALRAEKAAHAADRSSYERAQAEASAKALAAKLQKETEDAHKAEMADARATAVAADYHAAVLRFASAQRAASGEHLSSPPEAAESPDRPGGPTLVPAGSILIPQEDALICADGIARLQAGHEWALGSGG